MVIYSIVSSFINAVSSLIFGIFVIRQNARNIKNLTYFFFSLSVAIWSAFYFFWQISKTAEEALFYSRGLMLGAIFIPVFYLHHMIALLGKTVACRKQLGLAYAFAISISIFCFTPFFVSGVMPKLGYKFWPNPGLLFHPFLLSWVVIVFYGARLIFESFRSASGIVRNQMKYILFATVIGWGGGLTNYFLWYDIPFPPIGNILVSVYVIIAAYVIIKYRLMEVRLAVTRTGIFVLVYALIIGIPAFLIFQMRGFLEHQIGSNWWVLPAVLFSLLSFSGPFLYLILQRKAEAVLLKEQRAYQQTLLQASRGMTLIKDLNKLLRLIVHILTKTVKITHARIFLWDSETKQFVCKAARGDHHKQENAIIPDAASLVAHIRQTKEPLMLEEMKSQASVTLGCLNEVVKEMEKLSAAVIVPSFVQERLLGFVVLGEKKSKLLYAESDLDTLSTLANQAALAIENCVFLTEFEHQQAHFFQAAKMADLGTMASGIAHQMNNRFHVIKLGVESALMTEIVKLREYFSKNNAEPERKRIETLARVCTEVAKSADHGGEIVKRLLDFSRLSEGFKPVSIHQAVTSCIRLWECKRSLADIDFRVDIPDGLVMVRGNFSEIEEILFNLLDNAYDALKMKEEAWESGALEKPANPPKGSIVLTAREVFWRDKRCVEIMITDTGIGMRDAVRKQIFVPFFTSKATSIKGTGLGLYVIRKMVDAHQGDIELESEYGKGTTFRIMIPAATENT